MISERFDFRIAFDCRTPARASFAHTHHHSFDFDSVGFSVNFNPEATFGIVDNVGGASASLWKDTDPGADSLTDRVGARNVLTRSMAYAIGES